MFEHCGFLIIYGMCSYILSSKNRTHSVVYSKFPYKEGVMLYAFYCPLFAKISVYSIIVHSLTHSLTHYIAAQTSIRQASPAQASQPSQPTHLLLFISQVGSGRSVGPVGRVGRVGRSGRSVPGRSVRSGRVGRVGR